MCYVHLVVGIYTKFPLLLYHMVITVRRGFVVLIGLLIYSNYKCIIYIHLLVCTFILSLVGACRISATNFVETNMRWVGFGGG